MIFVTGPLFAGKEEAICRHLGWSRAEFAACGLRDVQELAANCEDLPALADELYWLFCDLPLVTGQISA